MADLHYIRQNLSSQSKNQLHYTMQINMTDNKDMFYAWMMFADGAKAQNINIIPENAPAVGGPNTYNFSGFFYSWNGISAKEITDWGSGNNRWSVYFSNQCIDFNEDYGMKNIYSMGNHKGCIVGINPANQMPEPTIINITNTIIY